MPINVYVNPEVKARVEKSRKFSGSFPREAELCSEHSQLTFQDFADIFQQQLGQNGIIGIRLISVKFSLIHDPEDM